MSAHHQVDARLAQASPDYGVKLQVRQHSLQSDEPADNGGADSGASPFELALSGLASCTAITLRMYAQRKQWTLGDVHVGCSLRKQGDDFVITRAVSFGQAVPEEQRMRLAEICEKTPVTLLMKKAAAVHTTVASTPG
jgi:putative redox protein